MATRANTAQTKPAKISLTSLAMTAKHLFYYLLHRFFMGFAICIHVIRLI